MGYRKTNRQQSITNEWPYSALLHWDLMAESEDARRRRSCWTNSNTISHRNRIQCCKYKNFPPKMYNSINLCHMNEKEFERQKIVYENELNHLNFKKKKYGKIKVCIFNKRKTVFHTDKNEAKRNSSCRKKLPYKNRAMGRRMNSNSSFYILSGAKMQEDILLNGTHSKV